ncbi:hypothetical protein G6F37_004840 [Rhizopus arrhizus]|nr:hypothetical protein G6F38_007695 [Rhizopus arrhizus]KAG1159501.1 hypothetical protein G6F37_004840 [Rhizopus arrhizus]
MSNHVNIYRLSIDSGYMESRRRSQSSARPSLEDATRGIREYTEFDFEDSIHYDVADGVQQYKPLLSQEESFDESDIENLEQKGYKLPSEGGSIFTSFLNMANSIVGAGIIGLPFAFKEAGFWTGLLLLIGVTIVVDWTVRLLIYNGKLSGTSTYQDLMEFAFGKPGLIAISIFQFVFAFGGMAAYCVIIAMKVQVIQFHMLFVRYILKLTKDISKLAKTSALALAAIIIIIVSVAIEGPQMSMNLKGSSALRFNLVNNEVFQAIAVISFAFVCHHNSFLIFGSLKQPSLNRFAVVTHWSMGIALITCLALAVAGYWSFTDKTMGNILNNFPSDNVLINIARLSFGLNMFTTIPLEAFVCREVN